MYGLPTNKQNRFNFLANRFRTDVFMFCCVSVGIPLCSHIVCVLRPARARQMSMEITITLHTSILCVAFMADAAADDAVMCVLLFLIYFFVGPFAEVTGWRVMLILFVFVLSFIRLL